MSQIQAATGADDREIRTRRFRLLSFELITVGFGVFSFFVFSWLLWDLCIGQDDISFSIFVFMIGMLMISFYLILDGMRSLFRHY